MSKQKKQVFGTKVNIILVDEKIINEKNKRLYIIKEIPQKKNQ